jgi:hydrogenase maturation protease
VSPNTSLVIGIGNPLRGDDGVGWHLAEALGAPHLALQQLTPDTAAHLAAFQRVLFIDAWLVSGDAPTAAPQPLLRRLVAAAAAPGLSHHLDPSAVLGLSEQLYGRSLEAWQLLIPAAALGHGDTFSAALRAQLPQARALLRDWLEPNRAALAIQG